MIIFNLGAILVGILTVFLGMGFATLAEGYLSDTMINLTMLHIFLIVSLGVEFLGLKPRLFFIPMWILALISIATDGYDNFGIISILYTILLTVGGIFSLIQFGNRFSQEEFMKNREYLKYYFDNLNALTEEEKISNLANSFSRNSIKSTEFLQHHKTVLELIIERHPKYFAETKQMLINDYLMVLDNLLNGKEERSFHKKHREIRKIVSAVFL